MAATVEDFTEVLRDEVCIDVGKLREYATNGVPEEIRGVVWPYLTAEEKENQREREEEYAALDKSSVEFGKHIQFAVERHHHSVPLFRESKTQRMMVNIISAVVNYEDEVFSPHLVHLLAPLAAAIPNEATLYSTFVRLLDMIAEAPPVHEQMAEFMSLFRSLFSELHQHFEDEEIEPSQWALSWMQNLLARELQLDNVLRLWDTYFAEPDGLSLHVCVCLAILEKCKEDLEELEQQELNQYLFNLPEFDMTEIIVNARTIRHMTTHLV